MRFIKPIFILFSGVLICLNSYATLSTPTLLYPSNGSSTNYPQFTLGLSAISGVIKYRYQADTSKNFSSPILMDSVRPNANFWASVKFPYGSTVYVRCKVYSATDSSNWSTAVYVTISDKTKLTSPADGFSGVVSYLQWTSVGQVDYEVMIDTSKNFNSPLLCYRKYKNYSMARAYPDSFYFSKKYYWKVRAIDGSDTLKWSDLWSYTFQTVSKITFPAPASNYMGRSASISVFWENAGMAMIQYQLSTHPSFSKVQFNRLLAPTSNKYDTLFFLDYATKYYCRLRFVSKVDSLPWAIGGNYTTLEPRIIDPYNGKVINYPGENIGLYGDYDDFDTFELQVDTNINFPNPIVDSFTTKLGVFYNQTRLFTTYYARVRGLHYKDTSAWSAIRSFATTTVNYYMLYTVPQDKATNTDLAFIMQWSGLINKIPYLELDLDTTTTFNSPQHQNFVGAWSTPNNFSLSNLLFGTKYYFRFKIGDPFDTSEWSTIRNFTTSQVTLKYDYPPNTARNWNIQNNLLIKTPTVKGIKYYLWQLDTTPKFNSPILRMKMDTGITTFKPQGSFYLGLEYYWRVAAANDKDTSDWGPTWNYQTHTTFLNKPLDGAIDQVSPVKLEWGGHSDLVGYFLLIDTSTQFKTAPVKIADGMQQTYTTSSLTAGKTYYWTILPYNEIDTGTAYTVYHFTMKKLAALTTPQLYFPANNATNVDYAAVYFSWQSFSESGMLYNLQISNNIDFTSLQYDQNQLTTSANIAGFTENTSYYWRVKYKRSSGDTGPWSGTFKFTTKAKPNGIQDQLPDGFEIYPNPVQNELTIKTTEEVNISIYNSTGQMILSRQMKTGLNTVSFSGETNGIYLLQIMVGDRLYVRQIVKE
jgi:hypothetical protein